MTGNLGEWGDTDSPKNFCGRNRCSSQKRTERCTAARVGVLSGRRIRQARISGWGSGGKTTWEKEKGTGLTTKKKTQQKPNAAAAGKTHGPGYRETRHSLGCPINHGKRERASVRKAKGSKLRIRGGEEGNIRIVQPTGGSNGTTNTRETPPLNGVGVKKKKKVVRSVGGDC